jgi:hypothetical protein
MLALSATLTAWGVWMFLVALLFIVQDLVRAFAARS